MKDTSIEVFVISLYRDISLSETENRKDVSDKGNREPSRQATPEAWKTMNLV